MAVNALTKRISRASFRPSHRQRFVNFHENVSEP